MLTLYRTDGHPESRTVQSALEESCLAHKVVDRHQAPATLTDHATATVLVDDDNVYRGAAEILPHVEELITFRELWHKYGSDACYCDDEGNIE